MSYIYIYIYIYDISSLRVKLIYCSEMYKYLHEFFIKLFQIPVYMRLLT